MELRQQNDSLRLAELAQDDLIPGYIDYETWQQIKARYIFARDFCKDKAVLEIGCGVGYGSSFLKRKGAIFAIGGDISSNLLKCATVLGYKSDGLGFVCLDAVNLPFQDESFDVIVMFEVIEHLKKPRKFLAQAVRILKPGGLFICSTPNKRISSPFTPWPMVSYHRHEFWAKEFVALLKEYFRNVELYGQGYLGLKAQIKSLFVSGCGAGLLSYFPRLLRHRLKVFLKKHVLRLAICANELEIQDEAAEIARVIPYRSSLRSMPTTLITIAKKNLN